MRTIAIIKMSDEFKIHAAVQNLYKTIKATKSVNVEQLTDSLKSTQKTPSVCTQVRLHQAIRGITEKSPNPNLFAQHYESVASNSSDTRKLNSFMLVLENLLLNQNTVRILKRHAGKDVSVSHLMTCIEDDIEKAGSQANFQQQQKGTISGKVGQLAPEIVYTQEDIKALTESLAKKSKIETDEGTSKAKQSPRILQNSKNISLKNPSSSSLGTSISSQNNINNNGKKSNIVIPDWYENRPYLNNVMIPNVGSYLNQINPNQAKLGNLPADTQEQELILDLLHMFIGLTGKWVKVRYDENDMHKRIYEVDSSCEPGLKTATMKLLPLVTAHIRVSNFVNTYAFRPDSGQTLNALGSAIRRVLYEYTIEIQNIYDVFINNPQYLTLQRLHATITGPNGLYRKMQLTANICQHLNTTGQQGPLVLSWLFDRIEKTGDDLVEELYSNILNLASMPFNETLNNWLAKGEISNCNLIGQSSNTNSNQTQNNFMLQYAKNEFMISEIPYFGKDELSTDFNSQYWERRFNFIDANCPNSMVEYKDKILKSGKYVKVINDCLSKIKKPDGTCYTWVPPIINKNNLQTMGAMDNHDSSIFGEIDECYKAASSKLLDILIKDHNLIDHLFAVKRYLLFGDCGIDTMSHLFHIAEKELFATCEKRDKVTLNKINRLLELSLKSSIGNKDNLNDFVTANFEEADYITDLAQILSRNTQAEKNLKQKDQKNSEKAGKKLRYIDILTLNWNATWPNNIVLSRKALTQYQLLFRHLLYCKIVENELSGLSSKIRETMKISGCEKYYNLKNAPKLASSCSTSTLQTSTLTNISKSMSTQILSSSNLKNSTTQNLGSLQSSQIRSDNRCGNNFSILQLTSLISSMMSSFVKNFQYYMYSEVIEPHWLEFENKLKNVKDLDEVIEFQNDFLENCTKDCLLSDLKLLRNTGNLLEKCLSFCRFVGRSVFPLCEKNVNNENEEEDEEAVNNNKENKFANTKKILLDHQSSFKNSNEELVRKLSEKRCNTLQHALVGLAIKLNYNNFYV